MNRFISLLESGAYRKDRDVTYYAWGLCVTFKFLSEICNKVSGRSANFWINRYAILDISRLLRKKELAFIVLDNAKVHRSKLMNIAETLWRILKGKWIQPATSLI